MSFRSRAGEIVPAWISTGRFVLPKIRSAALTGRGASNRSRAARDVTSRQQEETGSRLLRSRIELAVLHRRGPVTCHADEVVDPTHRCAPVVAQAFRGHQEQLFPGKMLEVLLGLHRVRARRQVVLVPRHRVADRPPLPTAGHVVQVVGADPLQRVPEHVDQPHPGNQVRDPLGNPRCSGYLV